MQTTVAFVGRWLQCLADSVQFACTSSKDKTGFNRIEYVEQIVHIN